MSPEHVVRAWFRRVWEQGEEAAIDELLAPTAIAHGLPTPDGRAMIGPEAFKPFFRSFRSAFSDLRVAVTHAATEGTLCAVRCEVSGVHSGDGLGIPASGRPVAFSGMTFVRVEGGQIQEGWNSYDFLDLYRQLGIVAI